MAHELLKEDRPEVIKRIDAMNQQLVQLKQQLETADYINIQKVDYRFGRLEWDLRYAREFLQEKLDS